MSFSLKPSKSVLLVGGERSLQLGSLTSNYFIKLFLGALLLGVGRDPYLLVVTAQAPVRSGVLPPRGPPPAGDLLGLLYPSAIASASPGVSPLEQRLMIDSQSRRGSTSEFMPRQPGGVPRAGGSSANRPRIRNGGEIDAEMIIVVDNDQVLPEVIMGSDMPGFLRKWAAAAAATNSYNSNDNNQYHRRKQRPSQTEINDKSPACTCPCVPKNSRNSSYKKEDATKEELMDDEIKRSAYSNALNMLQNVFARPNRILQSKEEAIGISPSSNILPGTSGKRSPESQNLKMIGSKAMISFEIPVELYDRLKSTEASDDADSNGAVREALAKAIMHQLFR